MFLRALFLALLVFQEKPPDVPAEKIMLKIPDFYFVSVTGTYRTTPPFVAIPQKETRRYFIQHTDALGAGMGEFTEVAPAEFHSVVNGLLQYGVRDVSVDVSFPNLNCGYRDAVMYLLGCGYLHEKEIRAMAEKYRGSNWFESLYWLDEAYPGAYSWRKEPSPSDPPPFSGDQESTGSANEGYFWTLRTIKENNADIRKLMDLRKRLDDEFEKIDVASVQPWQFSKGAQEYAELYRHGVPLLDAIQERLFSGFLNSPALQGFGVVEYYAAIGLPLPTQKIASDALTLVLKRSPLPDARIVTAFRVLKVDMPKDYAVLYRDRILEGKEDTSFENLDFLIRVVGEHGVDPEAWKKYGDSAFSWWHGSAEARKYQHDAGDWYHATVESYRRVLPVQREIESARAKLAAKRTLTPDDKALDARLEARLKLLGLGKVTLKALIGESDDPKQRKDLFADLTIRGWDLLRAFELNGMDPKDPYLLGKFELRARVYETMATGTYRDKMGRIRWYVDDFGKPLFPHRERLELACYLHDQGMIREILTAIVDRARDCLIEEGREFFAAHRYECPIGYETFRKELESSESPGYAELEATIAFAETLGTADGVPVIYEFAQRLHDACFERLANECFDRAGLGQQATRETGHREKPYPVRDAADWLARERRFNFEMRVYGQFDNSK